MINSLLWLSSAASLIELICDVLELKTRKRKVLRIEKIFKSMTIRPKFYIINHGEISNQLTVRWPSGYGASFRYT